ncbi:hypothetical protein PVAND_008109 [Polypedilum vanderplanki]|uniref:Uncharacterized protein n=1 Tax=Polypedilum vanderplanki TaxID=319348 RepID=A0A9J6C9J4_POLVA|nr:hypothetical protein PVAND_008109 [Polypedilum vanderplanki]
MTLRDETPNENETVSPAEYDGGTETVSVLKDISPPPTSEPVILPNSPQSKEAPLRFFKDRIVTATYLGRNIKQGNEEKILILTQYFMGCSM